MIYAILGQTASGKTDLACHLARQLHLPLIGADAFQMYKELNVGSAKPKAEDLKGLTYHLIDCCSVKDQVSVKLYQEECRKLLDSYTAQGQDVILSGGTFLYVRAALYPYNFPDEEDVEDDGLDKLTKEEAYARLKSEDPEAASKLDMNNTRRVIRALRICASGVKKSDLEMKDPKPLYPVRFLCIDTDKDEGNKRIDERVESMFGHGLLEEAQELAKAYDVKNLTAFQAIGYKEVFAGLAGRASAEEMKEQVKLDTRRYAKRQRTFLRHQFPSMVFLKAEEIADYIVYEQERRKRNQMALSPVLLNRIEKARVCLVGLGGVGSIVADGLVRLGVGDLTLIDKDKVEGSNLNRQLLYDKDDVGLWKAEAADKKLRKIDPYADIKPIKDCYKNDYVNSSMDFVFDCIDDVEAKADLALFCLSNKIPFICATGAALRKDSSRFKVGDLSQTGEPLAKKLKSVLKTRGLSEDVFKQIPVAFSSEVPQKREDKVLGSNVIAPNGEGLCLLSFFVSSLEKICDN